MPLDESQTTLVQKAQDENKKLKDELVQHAAKLQTELLSLDQLIASTELVGDADLLEDAEDKLIVLAEGAKTGPQYIHPSEFDDTNSPFYADAQRRREYITFTTPRTMTTKEKEQLSLCVRNANMRVVAAHAQERGEDPFGAIENVQDTTFFDNNLDQVDWHSVAAEFNAAIYPAQSRSALECEVFWRDGLRPNINCATWSEHEIQLLENFVQDSEETPPDWEDVARKIGNGRVALDCMKQFHLRLSETTKDRSKNTSWSKDNDAQLEDAVKVHGLLDWQMVSMAMHGTFSAAQCEAHWRSLHTTKRGPWEADEDEALRRAVRLFSAPDALQNTENIPWRKVAPLVQGRSRVQCRDRWLAITGVRRTQAEARREKARWLPAEDKLLKSLLGGEWGKRKPKINWKDTALALGKSERNCRSRWRSMRTSSKYANSSDGEDKGSGSDDNHHDSPSLRSSASDEDAETSAGAVMLSEHGTLLKSSAVQSIVATLRTKDVETLRTVPDQDPAMTAAAGTLLALGQATSSITDIPEGRRRRKDEISDQVVSAPSASALLQQQEFSQGRNVQGVRRSSRSTRHTGSLLEPTAFEDDVEVDVENENESPAPMRRPKLKRWTNDEDDHLLTVIARMGDASIDWDVVALDMEGRTATACSLRYKNLSKKRDATENM